MENYIVHHQRRECEEYYSKLTPQNYNNTECVLLSVRNSGELNPSDVTFNDKTWLENSADLLGINHESILSPLTNKEFAYTSKPLHFYEFLKKSDYEYALISDSTDAVILKNPDHAVRLLDLYECEILYSVTEWPDHDSFTMPDIAEFTAELYGSFKLNAGVCIGRTKTLLKLMERVLEYAEYLPIRIFSDQYRKTNGYSNWTKDQLADFPKGVSSEQTIIRYLFKEYYPLIKLDNKILLAQKR